MGPPGAVFNFLNSREPHSLLPEVTKEIDAKRTETHPDGITYDIWSEGWGHQLTPPGLSELLQLQIQPNELSVESKLSESKIKVAMQRISELGAGMVCMTETNLDLEQSKNTRQI